MSLSGAWLTIFYFTVTLKMIINYPEYNSFGFVYDTEELHHPYTLA